MRQNLMSTLVVSKSPTWVPTRRFLTTKTGITAATSSVNHNLHCSERSSGGKRSCIRYL